MKRLDKDNKICSYRLEIEEDKAFKVILNVDYPNQYIIGYDTNNRRRPWWLYKSSDIPCKRYIEDLGLDKEIIEIIYKVLEVEGIHILNGRPMFIVDKTRKQDYSEKEIVDKLYKKFIGVSIPDNVIDVSIYLGQSCGCLYYSENDTVEAISSVSIKERVIDENGYDKEIILQTDFDREDSFIRDIITNNGLVIEKKLKTTKYI